jgi:diguanylate cyclase (GGDEF)-like protein/PAS domain S-box-containing protein
MKWMLKRLPCPCLGAPVLRNAEYENTAKSRKAGLHVSLPRFQKTRPHLTQIILAFMMLCLSLVGSALAVEAVRVPIDVPVIDLTTIIERNRSDGDVIQISTAPGPDGIVRRIAVRAKEAGARPDWIVFALTNDSDEQIDRLLVAPFHRLVGSGVIWPDLGSSRIEAITASQGLRPDREAATDADIFVITLDPGATVTFVAELKTANLPQLYLWEPDAYKIKQNGLTLYRGIIIGITGLLALFLTVIFVVKGQIIFPAAALLAWAVLGYAGLDFGFFQRVIPMTQATERIYRAATEAMLAAALLVFLFAYLNLARWHVRYSHVTAVWLVFLTGLIGLAVFDAPTAAGVARISIAAVAVVGFVLILHLASHGYERAVMLIPTWLLLGAWTVAAGFAVTGQLTGDVVSSALVGGLVLTVMLIGFTVVQHAFVGAGGGHGVTDAERRALALSGSGDMVFDWDVTADRIHASPEVEMTLGLPHGALEGQAAIWLDMVHTGDRDRFRANLDTVLEQRRGRLNFEFRMRSSMGDWSWFALRARPVLADDGEVSRVIGTLSDITEARIAQDRLLQDAVHDSLTGLPNRELFLDRLEAALNFARSDEAIRPSVLLIDIDRFKQVNDAGGYAGGDAVLLTLARRLARILRPQDTLARAGSDEFAIILASERDSERIVALAELVRRAVATPVTVAEREVFLTCAIGIALFDGGVTARRDEMLKHAELAMIHAKRQGGDRIEVFRPAMRTERDDRLLIESDLRKAIERGEIIVVYQPIVRLEDRTVAGFEALLRWDHPKLGRIFPQDFIPIAEETGLIIELGAFVMDRAARELAAWQAALEVEPPIFVSVNVSSRQMIRNDLVRDVRTVLQRSRVLPGTLKLEITENLVMENPEYAAQILTRLKEIGAGLSLDDFGTGYSSLAYLLRFPFDTVKIDQSFVKQLSHGRPPVIIRSIITLAEDLGMDVVAEGVETESDAIALSQLGAQYAQGYAFDEPMTAVEARRLVGAAVAAA